MASLTLPTCSPPARCPWVLRASPWGLQEAVTFQSYWANHSISPNLICKMGTLTLPLSFPRSYAELEGGGGMSLNDDCMGGPWQGWDCHRAVAPTHPEKIGFLLVLLGK